jgi:hypothetical membrane protein
LADQDITPMKEEKRMDDKMKKIKKMGVWTIAIFATIFAVAFTVLWLPNYQVSHNAMSALGQVFAQGWLILVIDLVLCVGVYLGYRLYLNRK